LIRELTWAARRRRIERLRAAGRGRAVRIHSVATEGDAVRIAFEFLDPPGPYTLQFYQAETPGGDVAAKLVPGAAARYYESADAARTRLLETVDGEPVWPA